ncbi:MAG: DUF4097 family beta strand repeat-containing protein [Bacillota bacterium]|nr:DUF4097 family beta strand repeat-containing protein [Bacillota bacterium]
MSKGLKKFFIICAIMVGVGLVMLMLGFVTGGIQSIDKLAERYDWIHGNEERVYMHLDEGAQFDSIQVTGDADVVICTGDTSKTRVSYGEKGPVPELYVEDGVLKINAEVGDGGVISLGDGDTFPVAEIYCPEGINLAGIDLELDYGDATIENVTADRISIDSDFGDIDFTNVTFNSADIVTDDGDIDAEGITSGGLVIESNFGDCDLSGTFTGTTEITVDDGEVDLHTSLTEEQYTVTTDMSMGELIVGANHFEGMEKSFTTGSGPNVIKVISDFGDVEIQFGL